MPGGAIGASMGEAGDITKAVVSWYLPTGWEDVAKTVAVVAGLYAIGGYRGRKLIKVSTVALGALSAWSLLRDAEEEA